MATCSRPLFLAARASPSTPPPPKRATAPLLRLRLHTHRVATVYIWGYHRSLQVVVCGSTRRRRCSKAVQSWEDGLVCQTSLSALLRAINRVLSRCASLLISFHGSLGCHEGVFKHIMSIGFGRAILGMVLVMSLSATTCTAPSSSALTEENLLFLEAWRAVDRAYYDKSFNGQSWFRYRENALRNEPMNTREETYAAIRKMLSTLDDPFTRFLEPEKFKTLRSGTQGALTGVGLSIGYPMAHNGSPTGLVVMSSTPGGPAEKAGILPGDIILAIDNRKTDDMDIYDAADHLQGPEGSSVDLAIRSGPNIRHVILKRERVTLNPVRSRMCEITGAEDRSKIGYIKLTTFNQNAAESVKEAIKTLRDSNVKSFVLDLRNNSGGLFPEGIEIAKFWMDKGVIVYICDSRGVRDIYEADGINTIAATEPLVVLVNKGTASASEILAGALKDNKRAVIYGEPTFGKGKIQSVFALSDGSGLAVTVARYETPAQTDIDKVGVIPDHPLPASFPTDEDGFCSCLRDAMSPCNHSATQLFSRS